MQIRYIFANGKQLTRFCVWSEKQIISELHSKNAIGNFQERFRKMLSSDYILCDNNGFWMQPRQRWCTLPWELFLSFHRFVFVESLAVENMTPTLSHRNERSVELSCREVALATILQTPVQLRCCLRKIKKWCTENSLNGKGVATV